MFFRFKKLLFLVLGLSIFLTTSCGIYKPVDARKVPLNEADKRKKNIEEGKRIKFGTGSRGGDFQFATSNELWRASVDILSFMPISEADYGGGILITDWYNENSNSNESIKITVRFLSNEIRADGLDVIVHKKKCLNTENCRINLEKSEIGPEIKLAILKKAAILKKEKNKKDSKNKVVVDKTDD